MAISAAPTPPASSAAAVAGLEPQLLWQHFLSLSALPRPSKKEEAVVRWLKAFVEERKDKQPRLELREDSAGNVLIFRPGTGGGEDAEVICVQGVRLIRILFLFFLRSHSLVGEGKEEGREREEEEAGEKEGSSFLKI